MRKKLTSKLLDKLSPAEDKRYEVRDELVTGLLIRVSRTGGKVWYLATRIDGVLRRIKLGTYPVLSLKNAREKAQSLLRDIQLGTFQARDVEPAPPVLTLGDVIPQFITRYAQRQTKDWKGTESILQRMSGLHGMPINAIKRGDVTRELERLISDIGTKGGKGTRANRGLAAIKKLYSWCVDQGIVENSPVVGLKPPIREESRDRVLTDDEIIAYWKGCETEGYPFEQFGKLLLLTGQRRQEIAAMSWSELDLHRGTFTLKADRTKNSNGISSRYPGRRSTFSVRSHASSARTMCSPQPVGRRFLVSVASRIDWIPSSGWMLRIGAFTMSGAPLQPTWLF